MGDITRNFSYSEFKVSASYPHIAAVIQLTELDKYKFFWLAHLFLQPFRDATEKKIVVTSGIRRGELNERVGGVVNSDHCYNHFSAGVDFRVMGDAKTQRGSGDILTRQYFDIIYRICQRRREHVKQLIYYYPDWRDGQERGDFIHLSLRDKTARVWEVKYCVAREGRIYFNSRQEAEEYWRGRNMR